MIVCLVSCLCFPLVPSRVVGYLNGGLLILGLSLGLIVGIEVAILAKAFGVCEFVRVWTLRGEGVPAIQMIAMVAHALRVVLHLGVRAASDLALRAVALCCHGLLLVD